MVAGLEDYDSGDIFIRGKDLKKLNRVELAKYRRSSIGLVFQTFNLISSLSALDNVALPLTFSGVGKNERCKRAKEVLEVVGLKKRVNHFPSELSGGEQQRVAIARAFVTNPWILLVDEPTGNLDSQAGREIISILEDLNRKYKRTILLVTHDTSFFTSAERVLYMKDGKVTKQDTVPKTLRTTAREKTPPLPYFIPRKLRDYMGRLDLLGLAFKHFRFAKTRTFLTVLGLVIGISAIILLVSLGFGLQKITTSALASFESLHTITVTQKEGSSLKLDDAVVEKINGIENTETVSPVYNYTVSGTLLGTTTGLTLKGLKPENLAFEQVEIVRGQEFSGDRAKETIISGTALKNLDLKNQNVLGETIKIKIVDLGLEGEEFDVSELSIKELQLKVVGISSEGVLPEIYVPLEVIKEISTPYYGAINAKVTDRKKIKETMDKIEDLGFEASAVAELIKQIDAAFLIIQIILGLIGGIGLVVASFGIINTMVISLLERTHEIGVMKAIGITTKDVKRLFLYEASLFGFFGGLLGIVWGWLLGQGLNYAVYVLMTKSGEASIVIPFITPYKFVIVILVFAIFIAWFAGIYPAWRAAKISPLEALRYE
jgi:macrolide transport system ATP-binding/permease protein